MAALGIEDEEEGFIQTWKSTFGHTVELDYNNIGIQSTVSTLTEHIVAANEVLLEEPTGKEDLFEQTLAPNVTSCLTREGLRRLREDTEWICSNKTFRDILYNPMEGIMPQAFARSSRELLNYTAEINYVYHHSLTTDKMIPDEPLFQSFDEVKDNLNLARLSEEIQSQHAYYKEIQQKDHVIETVKKVVTGQLSSDDDGVNCMKQTDEMARSLLNSLESLILFRDLLLKLKLPNRGEHAYACVVVTELSARRYAQRLHAVAHRGSLLLLSVMSTKIWTLRLADIANQVVKSCSICASYFQWNKTINHPLRNIEAMPNSVWIDVKNPIASKKSTGAVVKKWILVAINTLTYMHNFILLEDMSAKEFATKFFEQHIKYYGAPQKLIFDRGSNFLGDVAFELYLLISVPIRIVTAANPKANHSEPAVGRFSRALKAVVAGDSILQWKQHLPLIQLIVNSSYCHPVSGRTPYELSGCSPYGTIYSTFVLFETEQELQMSKLWRDKVARALANQIQTHHKTNLSVAKNAEMTNDALELKVGKKCYYRVHDHTNMVAGLSPLLPKWITGTIVSFPGKTSLLIESDVTGKVVSRHISDVHPAYAANKFGPTPNSKKGFHDFFAEASGAAAEFEEVQEQLELAARQKDERVQMERGMGQPGGDTQQMDESTGARPKTTLRRSRRLQKLDPEEEK